MYFVKQASIELERASRLKTPTSILIIDIDDFKQINDTYGHKEGDNVLIEVCKTIGCILRTYDIFARYGGEEFVVLMPETCANESKRVAERIVKTVSGRKYNSDVQLEKLPTVSIGGYVAASGEYDIGNLVHLADKQLYNAKRSGKNQVSF